MSDVYVIVEGYRTCTDDDRMIGYFIGTKEEAEAICREANAKRESSRREYYCEALREIKSAADV